MGVPDPALLADLGSIWGGNTMSAGLPSVMNLGGAPAVASDAAIAGMNSTATDPFSGNTMNSSWWDRNMPSNQQLGSALSSLGKGAGAAGGSKDAAPIMPSTGGGGAGIGGGRGGGVSLDALVQMLAKRREALMASATGGVGAGVPQGAQRTTGLLGF